MEKDRRKLFESRKDIKNDNNKKIKSYLYLGFYIVFFLVLIFIIRGISTNNTGNKNNETKNSYIVDESYSFESILKIEKDIYKYTGKRYKEKYKYTLNTNGDIKEYTTYYDITLIKEAGLNKLTAKPVKLFDFLSPVVVNEIIKNSQYNRNADSYEIKSEYLLKLSNVDNKKSNTINKMRIRYNNKKISNITIDISEYLTIINGVRTEGSLELSYSNIGKVEDFEIGI